MRTRSPATGEHPDIDRPSTPQSAIRRPEPVPRKAHAMPMTQENATWFADTFSKIVENVGLALLGKEERRSVSAMRRGFCRYLHCRNSLS